jgi:hypothetical protein
MFPLASRDAEKTSPVSGTWKGPADAFKKIDVCVKHQLSEFDQGRYVGILESQVADMKAERRLK